MRAMWCGCPAVCVAVVRCRLAARRWREEIEGRGPGGRILQPFNTSNSAVHACAPAHVTPQNNRTPAFNPGVVFMPVPLSVQHGADALRVWMAVTRCAVGDTCYATSFGWCCGAARWRDVHESSRARARGGGSQGGGLKPIEYLRCVTMSPALHNFAASSVLDSCQCPWCPHSPLIHHY
jgi:hypothetical protein